MHADQHGHWPISTDLIGLRRHLYRYMSQVGLVGTRRDDLLLAANEAVINVLEHGDAVGSVSVWHDEADLVVDVVDDAGRLTSDQADRRRPAPGSVRGFGLWLMGRLCDEFTIRQSGGRSHVRLRMRLHATPGTG
ncbi:ATP-binding protein [Streptosporangium sp. NPDC002721]|uniref:ATP-binding protein n=1 Tax=Streptosporangium sp. NPDC002721 TaxID=3366188 RepID=UPI0036C66D4C